MSHQEKVITSPIIVKEEIEPDRILLHCTVPVDLLYFQGHFANVKVVPGVCQIKWVMDAIQHYFGRKPVLRGMEAVKFHQLLFPGDPFMLEIKRAGGGLKWVYRITSDTKKIAAGRIVDKTDAVSGAAQ